MSPKRILGSVTAIIMTVFVALTMSMPSASAASYARSVDTPHYENGKMVASADINTNCEGTFGCYTYIKIERLPDPQPGVPGWLREWEDAGGHWARDGKNTVEAEPKAGSCATYRTIVDSYNDAPGDAVLGVSLGVVEFNLGGGVKRYHKANESSETHFCSMA